jgi:hypothetical protein
MIFTFPSETFPASTGVTIDVPSSWEPDPAGPGAMVFFDSDSPPEFRTNLTITLERVEAAVSLDVIAAKYADEVALDERFTALGEENSKVGGLSARLRAQTLQPAGTDVLVFQTQCLVVVPTMNTSYNDLVVAHASCSAMHSERYGLQFRQMFDSITFAGS